MKIKCPQCQAPFRRSDKYPKTVVKFGSFYRTSDRKRVQRLFCKLCRRHFSIATWSPHYRQKKRQINHFIARLYAALISQRECGRLLKINRKTAARKLVHMGGLAEYKLDQLNQKRVTQVSIVEFDDMETFEHTKCKPLSIPLAIEHKTRWILGFDVAQMPANGPLAAISRKKYGIRKDMRGPARARLFARIKPFIKSDAIIKSDQNPHYRGDIKRWLPEARHLTYKGRKGCIVGQGELKKIGFDPLFSLNHTCATFRARASRLIRRTWCTTKKAEMLRLHLAIVALHHNLSLPVSTG